MAQPSGLAVLTHVGVTELDGHPYRGGDGKTWNEERPDVTCRVPLHGAQYLETLKVGDVILDRYEVVRVLGEGGMGVVFAAHSREIGALVALKFIRPAIRDNPETRVRFVQEARIANRVRSEHVVPVHDVGFFEGEPFIVMDYLEGEDLAEIIRKRGPLPVAASVDLLLQACEAIHQAHTVGIVHRDLKPANLFVTVSPDRLPLLKVLDFGIAESISTQTVPLRSRVAPGTYAYMAPEQLAPSAPVDPRSDIWSLGVVLLEMLSGARPFAGDTLPVLVEEMERGYHSKISDVRHDVPRELEQLVSEMLARKPDARPSVEDLAIRLAPFGTDRAQESCARIVATTVSPRSVHHDDSFAPTTRARSWRAWLESERAEKELSVGERSTFGVAICAALAVPLLLTRATHTPPPGPNLANVVPLAHVAPPTPARDSAECKDEIAAYRGACDEGDGVMCLALGEKYLDGDCVAADDHQAGVLYGQACEDGEPGGCYWLSMLSEAGRGVTRDPERSYALAKRTCDEGFTPGCARAAEAWITGVGVAKDVGYGLAQLDTMCGDQGQIPACAQLTLLYALGNGDIPADPVRVREYAATSCWLGADEGTCALAVEWKGYVSDDIIKNIE